MNESIFIAIIAVIVVLLVLHVADHNWQIKWLKDKTIDLQNQIDELKNKLGKP